MNNRDIEIIAFLFVLLSLIIGANCVQQSGLFGEYLGQVTPDNEVQPFCPEVFSTQGKLYTCLKKQFSMWDENLTIFYKITPCQEDN